MTAIIFVSLVAYLLLNPHSTRILPTSKLVKASQCAINIEAPRCHIGGLDLSLVSPESEEWWTWTVEELSNSTKILLNCSNATSLLNLDHCSCKPNYTGERCDTCADGYHMKYIWSLPASQPFRSSSSSTTLKHLIRPNKKQLRIYDCKACECHSLGSKSHICDKKNGTCSCLDGYRGNKCDKCASGHYNNSLILSTNLGNIQQASDHGRTSKPGRCLKCDDCYDQWYSAVSDLKLSSVDLIKNTYNLAKSYASDLGLPINLEGDETSENKGLMHDIGNTKKRGDRLVELGEKLAIIGEIALSNKQNKDRFNLLSAEINSVIWQLNNIKTEFHEQEGLKGNIIDSLAQLTLRLSIETSMVDELTRRMLKFERIEAQQSSPEASLKLMKDCRDRSQNLMENSIKYHHGYQGDLEELREILKTKLDIARGKQAWFENFGLNLIEESMKTNQIDISSISLASVDFPEARLSTSLEPDERAILIDWTDQQSSVYLDGFDRRKTDLDSTHLLIQAANELVNGTESQMMNFLANLTTTLLGISQLNDFIGVNSSDINGSSEDMLPLFRIGSERLRMSLEKSDGRLSSAQLDLSDLVRSKNIMTKKFLELSRDLDETLEMNSAGLKNFTRDHKVEIEELEQLNKRTEMMLVDLDRRNNDSIMALQFERYANLTLSQTKETHIKTKEELNGLMVSLDAETRDIRSVSDRFSSIPSEFYEIPTSGCENCAAGKLKLLQERNSRLQFRSELERADARRRIASSRTEMNQVNLTNEALVMDLRECHHNLTKLGAAIEGNKTDHSMIGEHAHSAPTGSKVGPVRSELATDAAFSSKSERLYHYSRACGLINGYQDMERRLIKMLTRTESLSEEFSLNEQTFSRQRRTLDLLHNEMDRLIEDIHDNVATPPQAI